ncbi:heme-degrading domain-containing protein [Sodalis sp. RH21]|uniref:heme-degrading domain-containing protein n=1 Tax=unclassified Sodalis (in: enterobacteria) TaxID=2636512 RepID=UPI0039B3E2D2
MNVQQQLALCQHHQRLLYLPQFSHQLAWRLGERIKHYAEHQGLALAIDITVNQHRIFSYAMPGTTAENLDWARRKRNVVDLLAMGSYTAGLMLELRQETLQQRYGVASRDFAALGGGYPLQVANAGIVGSVTVSGAPHLEDHNILLVVLAEFCGLPAGSIEMLTTPER